MIWAIYRLSDGVVVKHFTGSRRSLEANLKPEYGAYEFAVDDVESKIDPDTKKVVPSGRSRASEQAATLQREVANLVKEEIERLERSKIRALTDHALAPNTQIEIDGRQMLPRSRIEELEILIEAQRERLTVSRS
jgi:hypothetical protein